MARPMSHTLKARVTRELAATEVPHSPFPPFPPVQFKCRFKIQRRGSLNAASSSASIRRFKPRNTLDTRKEKARLIQESRERSADSHVRVLSTISPEHRADKAVRAPS